MPWMLSGIGWARLVSQCRRGPGNGQFGALGRIEAAAIDGDDQVVRAQQLRIGCMDARRSPVGVERRMMDQRHHDRVPIGIAVPGVRILRPGADEIPYRPFGCERGLTGNGLTQHDVAILVPEREIVRTERRSTGHRRRRRQAPHRPQAAGCGRSPRRCGPVRPRRRCAPGSSPGKTSKSGCRPCRNCSVSYNPSPRP